jgi:hemolysin III
MKEKSLRLREPVNGLTHLVGAILGLLGMVTLTVISWPDPVKITSVIIYGLSLVALFAASAVYHLAVVKPDILQTLRKFDHGAIYVLIAGTYTPFCVLAFTGFFHWGLLALIWGLAIVGILVKVFFVDTPRWLNAGVYVLMGWLCIMAAPQISHVLSPFSASWLIIGGVTYTLGAVVYSLKLLDFNPGVFGFHEAWHVFVLLGALAHFIAVFGLISSPAMM